MRRRTRLVGLLAALILMPVAAFAQAPAAFEGTWAGSYEGADAAITIAFADGVPGGSVSIDGTDYSIEAGEHDADLIFADLVAEGKDPNAVIFTLLEDEGTLMLAIEFTADGPVENIAFKRAE